MTGELVRRSRHGALLLESLCSDSRAARPEGAPLKSVTCFPHRGYFHLKNSVVTSNRETVSPPGARINTAEGPPGFYRSHPQQYWANE